MVLPQFRIDVVICANCVVADVGGIYTIHPVRTPGLVNALIQGIGRGVRVIGTIASVRNQVAVVLKHIEMVVRDDALHFTLRPVLRIGSTEVNRLSLEGLRLPVGRKIGDHPIAHFRIRGVQGARLGR